MYICHLSVGHVSSICTSVCLLDSFSACPKVGVLCGNMIFRSYSLIVCQIVEPREYSVTLSAQVMAKDIKRTTAALSYKKRKRSCNKGVGCL